MTTVASELGGVLRTVGDIDLVFVLVALAFQLANLVLRSLAWRNVLEAAYPETRLSTVRIGGAYAAGVAANALTPARGGELVKIALARTQIPGSSVPTIAGSSAVLLVFDSILGAVLLTVAAAFGAVPFGALPAVPGGWGAAPVALVLAAGGLFLLRRAHGRLAALRHKVAEGGAVLRTPRVYARRVVSLQILAWTSRLAVVLALLAAFGLPVTLPVAALIVVAGGLSTVGGTPGGVGTQQLLLVGVLHGTATVAEAVSFSVVLQVGVTTVNLTLGLAGTMLVLRTWSPRTAVRAVRR